MKRSVIYMAIISKDKLLAGKNYKETFKINEGGDEIIIRAISMGEFVEVSARHGIDPTEIGDIDFSRMYQMVIDICEKGIVEPSLTKEDLKTIKFEDLNLVEVMNKILSISGFSVSQEEVESFRKE